MPITWQSPKLLLMATSERRSTSLDVALTFLAINGFEIEDEQMELYDAMIAIAEKKMSKEELASLFEKLTTA